MEWAIARKEIEGNCRGQTSPGLEKKSSFTADAAASRVPQVQGYQSALLQSHFKAYLGWPDLEVSFSRCADKV